MDEQWKLIEEFPRYEVSDLGRVRNIKTGHILRHRACGRKREQYATVLLAGRNKAVHRLVAHYFIGPRPPGMYVNHIDSDKMNPVLVNLEYVTPSQNTHHSYKFGPRNKPVGELNPAAKLTAAQVSSIRSRYVPRQYGQKRLAREFGVTQSAIWGIVTGKTWKEVR